MIADIAPVVTERLRGERTRPEDLDPWSRTLLDDEFDPEGQWPYDLRTPEYALEVHDQDLAHWTRFGFGPWSVRERDTADYVGRVGLDYTRATGRPEVQVGWIVAARARNRGYATEMAAEAVRIAFDTLELDELIALITPANGPSLAVASKLGFAEIGSVRHHGLEHLLLRLER